MQILSIAVILLILLGIAVYTWNYGRWAWSQKLRVGAIGLYLLSLLTIAVPVMVLWYNA